LCFEGASTATPAPATIVSATASVTNLLFVATIGPPYESQGTSAASHSSRRPSCAASSCARNCASPRCSRLFTVASGTPDSSAIRVGVSSWK
jgi:hypothetical protein